MTGLSNVVTGLIAAVLGLALILWVIPAQTVPAIFASVSSGFYPNFTAGLLIASGIGLALSGLSAKSGSPLGARPATIAINAVVAAITLVGAAGLMVRAGFVPAGIIICLVTLILMRENRWPLVAAICIGAPLVLWAGFELLLGRPLP